MLELAPMQIVDSFLLDYHVGHALALLFVLSVLGAVPLRSTRTLSVTLAAFGLLFLLTPASTMGNDPVYKFLGVVLIVVAPVLYALGRR